jgi:intracellular sulfur oxidation DsrE/DsrF family protein
MKRLGLVVSISSLVVVAAILTATQIQTYAQSKPAHRLAIQVTENDKAKMTMVLRNIQNAADLWNKSGETFEIEVVAYGPGMHMLRDDTSPVKDDIKSVKESVHHVQFSACENARTAMKKAEGKDIPLISQATPVPSGIVRVVELQEQGFSYARP